MSAATRKSSASSSMLLHSSPSSSSLSSSIPVLIRPWGSEPHPPPSPHDMMNRIGRYCMDDGVLRAHKDSLDVVNGNGVVGDGGVVLTAANLHAGVNGSSSFSSSSVPPVGKVGGRGMSVFPHEPYNVFLIIPINDGREREIAHFFRLIFNCMPL